MSICCSEETHDDGRDRVEHDVLEPRVHVVQDEEREERRGVHCAGLNDEGPALGAAHDVGRTCVFRVRLRDQMRYATSARIYLFCTSQRLDNGEAGGEGYLPVQITFVANVMEKNEVIQWPSCTTKISACGTTLSKEYRMPTPVAVPKCFSREKEE